LQSYIFGNQKTLINKVTYVFKKFIILIFVFIFYSLAFNLNRNKNVIIEITEPELISNENKMYSGTPSICSYNDKTEILWIRKETFLSNEVLIQSKNVGNYGNSSIYDIEKIKSVYIAPEIISDKEGIFHCIIGGNNSPDLFKPFQMCKDIYYSNNKTGKWSLPKNILHLNKNKEIFDNWKIKSDYQSNIHLLLSKFDQTGPSIIHYMLKDNNLSDSFKIIINCLKFDFLIDQEKVFHIAYSADIPRVQLGL
jgi:hypothetical protein